MRCPECGYVSFNESGACKRCGADLRKIKHRGGIPTFTATPVSPPPPRTPLPTGPGAAGPPQKPEDRAQEIDALFAHFSDSPGLAVTSGQGPQEGEAFRLPHDTLTPLDPLPGGMASTLGVQRDVSRPVEVGAPARAGFWIRLAAWIVDIVCLFLATIVLAVLVLATIWFGGRLGGEINDQVMALAGYSGAAIVMASGFLYFTLFVGSAGRTPGKTLFGLKIVGVNDQEMTYGRACLRSLCWILSLVLFSVGFLMIAFTRQKRGLHDILAGTRVIRTPRRP